MTDEDSTPIRRRMSRLAPVMAAIVVMVLAAVQPGSAYGQACCGSTQSSGIGRLGTGQRLLVGLDLQYRDYYGHFQGTRHASTSGTIIELRQTLFSTIRVGRDFQIGLTVPFVENHKDFENISEWGGGIADPAMSFRYELVQTGLYRRLPGVGLGLTAKAPLGRSIFNSMERGTSLLQTDVTGTGAYELGANAQLEWTRQGWFFGLSPALQLAVPFDNEQSRRVSRGPLVALTASVGYALYVPWMADEFLYLSLATSVEHTSGLRVDGAPLVAGSEQRSSVTLQAGGFVTHHLFLGLRVGIDPPIDGLGENLLSAWNTGLVLRRVFYD
jgi:hypothetical protein